MGARPTPHSPSHHPSCPRLLASFFSLDIPFQISPAFLERSVMLMPGWSDLIFSRLALSHNMYADIGLLGAFGSLPFFPYVRKNPNAIGHPHVTVTPSFPKETIWGARRCRKN